ncbi:MAG: hypothetical protein KAS32_16795 [Candidatus Peribacteraceae bacterium]|nr:hypothetical protein [Candidatus Peribacteraceae bacterium]
MGNDFKNFLTERYDYIEKFQALQFAKDFNLGLKEAVEIWKDLYEY